MVILIFKSALVFQSKIEKFLENLKTFSNCKVKKLTESIEAAQRIVQGLTNYEIESIHFSKQTPTSHVI